MGSLLTLWLVIAGLAMMVAGPKAAKKVLQVPAKFAANLVIDLTSAVLSFGFDLLGRVLRPIGRLINRGARRLLGLPPPAAAPSPSSPARDRRHQGRR